MQNNKQLKKRKYFAAANSYNGFVSYFDKIFPSEKFDRVYVLKGGPGTGKNSFMKKVSSELLIKDCTVDEIYCSSDPNSLDAVIAEKNEKRIAILDGTAPHERDAVIPGAIDEIINLGESWDSRWLSAEREKILEINKEKSKAYNCAYSYLKIAGSAEEYIFSIYSTVFDKREAKKKAEDILTNIPTETNPILHPCLISSFGKFGYYKIIESDTANINIFGDQYAAFLFIKTITEFAKNSSLSFVDYIYPLNPKYSEGVIFNSGFSIVISDTGEIDANSYLRDDKIFRERIKQAAIIKDDSLLEAQRWFAIASELHFEMENIYGKAMDYKKNDRILEIKLQEIKKILQI